MTAHNTLDENIINNDELLEQNIVEQVNEIGEQLSQNEIGQKNIDLMFAGLNKKGLTKDEYEKRYKAFFRAGKKLLLADIRLARAFKSLKVSSGFRSDKYKLKGNETAEKTKARILEQEFGIKYKKAWEIQQLDDAGLFEEICKEAKNKHLIPSRELGLRIMRRKKGEESKQKKLLEAQANFVKVHSSTAITLDDGKYNVIYANPPYESEVMAKNVAMTVEDMKKLQIPATDDAILFLWCSSEELINALDLIKVWGFKYLEHSIWYFVQAKNKGVYFKDCHRILLVATKGDNYPKPAVGQQKNSVYLYKPQDDKSTDVKLYYYETIERMFPEGAFLDVFSGKAHNSKWTLMFNDSTKE